MSHYKIPMAAKVAGTAFLAVLVPIYLHILWLGVLWLVAFLPTHLALRKIFAPRPADGLKLPVRFL